MLAHSRSTYNDRSALETFGSCWPFIEAVVQVAARLDHNSAEKIGYATGAIKESEWQEALNRSAQVAAKCGRAQARRPTSSWLVAPVETRNALGQGMSLRESLQPSKLANQGMERLMQLAQALTVWDTYRPQPFTALLSFLARICYEPPLVGHRAPVIVGIAMVSTFGKPSIDYYSGVALLRADDDERNAVVDARLTQIEQINAAYNATKKADAQRSVLPEVNPP